MSNATVRTCGMWVAGFGALVAIAGRADALQTEQPARLVIRVGTLHIGDGRVVQNAVVVIENGKITAAGEGSTVPAGAGLIDLPEGSVTPGLIDACAQIETRDLAVTRRRSPGGPGASEPQRREAGQPSALALFFEGTHAEGSDDEDGCVCSGVAACALANTHENLGPGQICPVCGFPAAPGSPLARGLVSGVAGGWSETEASSEVVPHTRVIDSLSLRSRDFDRLVRSGVTTVFVTPDSAAVIGPQGAIVRTAGPVRDRLISDHGAVEATFGSDAYSVGMGNSPPFGRFVSIRTRRPNTRMGVAWVFRKAFYDAQRWKEGLPVGGADAPPPEALPVLQQIREGKLGLRVQARTQPDILTAIRLCGEFGVGFTLVEGTEAYECLAELKLRAIPVIFGPIYDEADPSPRLYSGETDKSRLSTLRDLIEAGVPTALTAQDLRDEDGLARQVMYAVRAGVPLEKAVQAVTQTPAKMLGIDDQVGTIEAGKRADLVVWTGKAFDATSRLVVVISGGQVVVDARERAAAK